MAGLFRSFFLKFLFVSFWIGAFFLFLFSSQLFETFRAKKSLTIFTFPLLLDAQELSVFERETGIKIYIHYYENNDELVAKMLSTDVSGYDVIIPSDYAVKTLLQEKGVLQKIDTTRLNFTNKLHTALLGHYFDPNNEYSIPYQWEIYGIGYSKEAFEYKKPPATWDLIFDETFGLRNFGMIDNAREVAALASFYLFGSVKMLSQEKMEKVKQLLLSQKDRVEVYSDDRASYLITSKTCPAVVCTAGDIWRVNEFEFDFLLPKEGSFVVIDSICIPRGGNTDLVYQLINFLYQDDVMKSNAHEYSFWPATKTVSVKEGKNLMEDALNNFSKFMFYKRVATEEQLDDLWVALKAN